MDKRSQFLSMFTLQGILVLIVECMGLEKGLCLLTFVFYFSEGCCDYSWRRTERIFSSGSIHKTARIARRLDNPYIFRLAQSHLG